MRLIPFYQRTNLTLLCVQIIAGLLVLLSGSFAFLKGASVSGIVTNAVYWADGYLLFHLNAVFCFEVYEDALAKRTYTLFGLAFFVLPVVYAGQMLRILPADHPWLFDVSIVIQATFLGLIVYVVNQRRFVTDEKPVKASTAGGQTEKKKETDSEKKEKERKEKDMERPPRIQPGEFLGQGQKDIDTVIGSLKARIGDAGRFVTGSIVLMVLVIIFGGTASIGSEAVDNFKSYREIAIQRNNLEDLANRVRDSSTRDSVKAMYSFISKKFGKDYKEAVDRLATSNPVNWPEIILRITVALFTLFLVQVLFNIYKYNQQQISHLYSKAELIELYRPVETEQIELRKGLLARMENSPRFEKGPTAPTEQIINVLEKTMK